MSWNYILFILIFDEIIMGFLNSTEKPAAVWTASNLKALMLEEHSLPIIHTHIKCNKSILIILWNSLMPFPYSGKETGLYKMFLTT